jgi:hypothetical protein
VLRAQPDTLFYIEEDTTPALPPVRFHLQTLGAYWLDGRVQFFDGYNREILYADASTGLPLYSDWHLFSPNSLLPTYFQVGMQAGFTDSIRGLRLRMGVMYAHRTDTMSYSGGYLTTDTALGRLASESGGFGGVSITMMKQTRTLFKFLRLYGGAEFEAGLSPQSKIRSTEFAYDIGDEKLLAYNVFLARGRPRLNVFLNAVVGFETVFGKHYGFVAEVRSGLGSQLVVKEKAYGMARTAYMVGLQYYLWDHQRRPLPTRLHEVEPEIEPEIIAPGQ